MRWTYKKYMGDDRYSWAVFRGGQPYATGMDRAEAKRLKERMECEAAVKRMAAEIWNKA
jgi:hypothetical protein